MSIDPRILTGRLAPKPTSVILRAGPVSAELHGADLRHVTVGGAELVQRIYVAVRDAPWNTVPAVFSDWSIRQEASSFIVEFDARHRDEAIDFAWHGRIDGTSEGTIRYELDGVCHGVFAYSKIGFNVHHGLAETIGHAYRAETEQGELRGTLPHDIDPQRIVGTTLTGMFAPYRSIAIAIAPGLESVIALEGDLLELQDHRNWTDANFKSYATPLALGFPFDSRDGQRIHQVLTVSYRGEVPEVPPPAPVRIAIGATVGPLPAIGFGQPELGRPLSVAEACLIGATFPAHLRVDLSLDDPDVRGRLLRAAADARAIDAALELAVHANDGSGAALEALAATIRTVGTPVARVLVYALRTGFSAVQGATPAQVIASVREHLEPATGPVPFAGGTNQSFSDINRDRPTHPHQSGICFSISPTVHAADDLSIIENLRGQSEVVRMARSFADDRPVSVSPVTLATRFGPYPSGPSAPGDLPANVDVRQASLLGAAWTAASLKHLAESGAASVTYFEATGWRGIVEREDALPDVRFPSTPGTVFPLWHVFADVAEWRSGMVIAATSDRPLEAEALAVRDASGLHLLVANLGTDARQVELRGITGRSARIRTLDGATAGAATAQPTHFRAEQATTHQIVDGRLVLEVGAYGVIRVDATD